MSMDLTPVGGTVLKTTGIRIGNIWALFITIIILYWGVLLDMEHNVYKFITTACGPIVRVFDLLSKGCMFTSNLGGCSVEQDSCLVLLLSQFFFFFN